MMLLLPFAVFAVAALVGALGPCQQQVVSISAALAWLLNAVASALCVATGVAALHGRDVELTLGSLGGLGTAGLRVDRLAGLFLAISFTVAVPACLAAVRRFTTRRRLPALVAVTLASVLLILTADHLFVLLFGWETLTVTFYLLAGFDRQRAGHERAAVLAAGFGKVSGAALLAGGLLAASEADSFTLQRFGGAPHDTTTHVAFALLLLGFGVKVGLVPVQVWLPPAYAAAPGPARAVMAGTAVNVGFYGMWRALELLGPPPVWLACVVLVLAGVSAVLGIAHAAVHPDLAGLVAWSSVENAGIILAGFGVALVGSAAHQQRLMAAGLLAATAQVIAHSLGKTLLFTATSAIEESEGSTSLAELRGIARRHPWAGAGLVVGSMTLAGLPLTAGFASEWFTLESLMQQFRVASLPMQLASATAGALIALTVGIAGVTFVRLVALTAFSAGKEVPETPRVAGVGHRVAIGLLVTGCLGAAAAAPWEVTGIAEGLRPLVGETTRGALASPWVLQPVYADFSALSPSWLWVVIPALTAIIALVAVAFSGSRLWRVRRVPAWSSGSPGVHRGVGYTSFGYANPMRKVLSNLLLTHQQLEQVERAERQEVAETATFVEARADRSEADLFYRVDVVEVVERYLYQPLAVVLHSLVRVVRRVQSGRLDAYMTYMLVALLAVLAVATALS